ncbi:MAG: hypothetical protein ACKPBF_05115 [Actinomycetota bacterium]
MSQAGIFAFGCVVFFVVMTGAFFFGLATMRELANKQNFRGDSKPRQIVLLFVITVQIIPWSNTALPTP